MKYRCKYEYSQNFGSPQHVWTCIGRHGALHFHVSDMGQERADKNGLDRYCGGLEVHYRSPPDYMADHVPSQDRCWLLNQPCWHDGSSMYATDHLIPMWRVDPHDHERMFKILEREYEHRFEPKAEAAE